MMQQMSIRVAGAAGGSGGSIQMEEEDLRVKVDLENLLSDGGRTLR